MLASDSFDEVSFLLGGGEEGDSLRARKETRCSCTVVEAGKARREWQTQVMNVKENVQ